MTDKEIDAIYNNYYKKINDYALEMYHRVRLRWEEINVENATTETLIKARDFIQKELNKRINNNDR